MPVSIGDTVKVLHWVEDGHVNVFPSDTTIDAIVKFAEGYKYEHHTWEVTSLYGTTRIYRVLNTTVRDKHGNIPKKQVAYISCTTVKSGAVCSDCGRPSRGLMHRKGCKFRD